MTDLGPLNYFLDLKVSSIADGYYITHAKYTFDLISRANITDSKIVDIPIEYNCRLNSHDGESLSDATLYKQLVGSLIYLTVTRPDVSYAVHVVSQFMAALRSPHYVVVFRILRYLKGIIFDGLHFSSHSSLTLQAYLDANWAGDPIVDLLQDIIFLWVILLSLGEARNKQALLVPALKQNIEYWQLLQLNLFGYVGCCRILVLIVPLQPNFTVIIEVLFKLFIMMSSMNVLNILRLIVTLFVIICFRVHSHSCLFPLMIS